jgi:hypothetical protein
MLPVHAGCPHWQEISVPDFTVSQWGLQYELSGAALQTHPGCLQRFVVSAMRNPFWLGAAAAHQSSNRPVANFC